MEYEKLRLIDSLEKKRYNLTYLNIITTIKDFLKERNYKIDIEEGLNTIIYGINANIIKNGENSVYYIYQIEPDPEEISLQSINDTIEIIRLTDIYGISFDAKNGNIDEFKKKNPNYWILDKALCHIVFNKISYDFLFRNENDLYLFLSSIVALFEKYILIDDVTMKKRINNIWNYYDRDYDKYWNIDDFSNFCNELNLGMDYREILIEFSNLDKNNSGYIEENEFEKYILKYMKDSYFESLFAKYDKDPNNPEIHTGKILPENLLKFFTNKQKENITINELYEIILQFKESIPKKEKLQILENLNSGNKITEEQNEKLSISLDEFFLLLHSNLTNVLDFIEMNKQQNEKRPLNDYFINSTHNTYLTGDQLKSNSTPEMYGFSVLEGYRLVELDCYDGNGDDIIITHGFTFCGEIHLKDILLQLKKFGFVNSDYPIILSIENHLDKYHQKIMTKLFNEILVDLYILDQKNPPDYFPTLDELKRKFIIKCSGKRVIKDNKNIIPRSKIKYEDNTSYLKDKRNLKLDINTFQNAFKSFINNLKNDNSKNILKSSPKKNRNLHKTNTEDDDEIIEEKPIEDLDKIRGMLGTKFKINQIKELNYQPWEFVTVKSTKLEKYIDNIETREKIINYNTNSFMKAYPQSFASDNYNLSKIWISGAQVAALNIQSNEDNYTLLNKIFFMNNRNSGYVLKPKKLLPESLIIEKYENAKMYIVIRLLCMVNIQKLVKKEGIDFGKKKLLLKGFVIGSKNDMERNKKFHLKFGGNLLQESIQVNQNMVFDIYEKDLSFIYFKLYYDDVLIGRSVIPVSLMKEGYRKIALYDINCIECYESYLIVKITKTDLDNMQHYNDNDNENKDNY